MFGMLDAEFAMILYDGRKGKLLAARDPIGIRPLFYGYTDGADIIFASEAKNLVPICKKILPFPPGHYYDGERFVCYRDAAHVERVCYDDLDTICRNIREKLTRAVEKRLDSDAPLGFLLTGGTGQQLSACAPSPAKRLENAHPHVRRRHATPTPSTSSTHREAADASTRRPHRGLSSRPKRSAAGAPGGRWRSSAPMTSRPSAPASACTLLCRAIHRSRPTSACCSTGEVSDELFGYKYTDFAPSPRRRFSRRPPSGSASCICTTSCAPTDCCISVKLASRPACRSPTSTFVQVCHDHRSRPRKSNVYGKGKYLLRRAFEGDWLPQSTFSCARRPRLQRRGSATPWSTTSRPMPSESLFRRGIRDPAPEVRLCACRSPRSRLLYRELFEQYLSRTGAHGRRTSGCRTGRGPAATSTIRRRWLSGMTARAGCESLRGAFRRFL